MTLNASENEENQYLLMSNAEDEGDVTTRDNIDNSNE